MQKQAAKHGGVHRCTKLKLNYNIYQEHRLLLRGFKKTWILLMDDLFDVKGGKEGRKELQRQQRMLK